MRNESERRQAGNIAIQFSRTRSAQNSIYGGAKMYNTFITEKMKPFKRMFKEDVLTVI